MILDKRKKVNIIFYDGNNKEEVIDFFKEKCFHKYLMIIDNELHYKIHHWYPRQKTYIRPNNYISFSYDEDDWWYPIETSVDEFNKYFINIE